MTGVTAVDSPDASLVVLQIDSDGGTGSETVQGVVNPNLGDGLSALQAALDAAETVSDRDFSAGDDTIYHQFSRTPKELAFFDELRFATTLEEVITGVPEPSSLALLGIAALFSAVFAGSRRR